MELKLTKDSLIYLLQANDTVVDFIENQVIMDVETQGRPKFVLELKIRLHGSKEDSE